ncbi:ribosomal protein S18-alanine N-acetyltransferase [Pontibacillus yanchengensis]|uniref:[Ribosomal protein bS18]-alanine N-acetyltransferase n=1 Tax=Pontibacillus yanchengensis Y32 TaxID=1385514 RepID=A0A0A2TF01_9BACI|nr:ribosomal protein S18-alanine N-acetyltransferase [Pontibacillus yanchengensis]KGP72701.1 alanine acetyltransferase [Pontibacillus yanchengensis Y32]
MSNAIVRRMVDEDIDSILTIEEQCFATPWTRDAFDHELHDNPYALYYVIEIEGTIIGYCGLWLIIDEAHVTNIAILPSYRGKRLGNALFNAVLTHARQLGAIQLSLEVRVSNVVAQKMYRRFGLIPGGIRKNYYTDNHEDALVMWVKL